MCRILLYANEGERERIRFHARISHCPPISNSTKISSHQQIDYPTTMSVVGIDFGAKHSVIAAAGRGGVDVILNGNSQRLNP